MKKNAETEKEIVINRNGLNFNANYPTFLGNSEKAVIFNVLKIFFFKQNKKEKAGWSLLIQT